MLASCGGDSKGKTDEPETPPVATSLTSGTWITSTASTALNSQANIVQAVTNCKKAGINNIYVVVWGKGATDYPSKITKDLFGYEIDDAFVGRDPLKEIIAEAHNQSLKVYAWFEYGFAASCGQNGGKILQTKPSWAAKDSQGNYLTKNGFVWMNPINSEVQDFMKSLVLEVVKNYDVDGVMGDDRLPAMPVEGGYDDYTINLYKTEHNGNLPPSNVSDNAWMSWRAGKLTAFLADLYQSVKKVKSNVKVASAPSIHPWGYQNYLQDWPTWLKNGYVDIVIPQIYRYDIDSYKSTLAQQINYLEPKDRSKFFPGVLIKNGTYDVDETFLQKMIDENRRQGFKGESFWFYEGLAKHQAYFAAYGK